MDEVQFLADRVVVIAAGKIVAEGTPDTLAGREKARTVIRFLLPASTALPEQFRTAARIDGQSVEIEAGDPTRTLFDLTSWAVQAGVSLEGIEVARPTLEDVYLEITKEAEAAPA
jgi:ABC-2 type transport system ATP-binding protein